jgi:hypothetical protein
MKKMALVLGSLFFATSAFSASNFVKEEYEDVLKKTTKQDYSECWKARYKQKLTFLENFMKDAQKVSDLDKKIDEVCKSKVSVGNVMREKPYNIYYVMYRQDKEPSACQNSPDTKDEHAKGKTWYVSEMECEKRASKK